MCFPAFRNETVPYSGLTLDPATDETERLRLADAAQRFSVQHDAVFTAIALTEIYHDAVGHR